MYTFYMFSTLLMHKYYKKIKIWCFLFISNFKVVFKEDIIFLVKCIFKYFTCNVNGRRCVIFNYVDIYIVIKISHLDGRSNKLVFFDI